MTYKKITLAALTALYLLAACSPLTPPPPPPPPPTPLVLPPLAPAEIRDPAPMATYSTKQIDTANSLIVATVRRGGVLARLGHDHVVASHTVTGSVTPALNRADFTFRLDQMKIDEADLRQIAGLEKQPSADAIEGTRHNMLTKVLDADRYPVVNVHAERTADGQPLQVSITLHGVTRTLAIPVELREDKESGIITVKGTVNLKQTDFGLTPFSVMAGAMSVQDQMELRFDLRTK